MRRRIIAVSIVAAVLVGLATAAVAQRVGAERYGPEHFGPERPAYGQNRHYVPASEPPTRWEYATLSFHIVRETWAWNMSQVAGHFEVIDALIQDVASGRVTSPDSVMARAVTFFGDQGPWYTVGWVMGSTIEKALGRDQLVTRLCDPAALIRVYQKIIAERDQSGPKWSPVAVAWLSKGGM